MISHALDFLLKSIITVIIVLLSVSGLAITCTEEDAVDLTGFDEVTDTSQEVFSCGDGRFLTAIDLDEYDLNSNRGHGYYSGLTAIEAMKWTCSDGKTSAWFGNHSDVHISSSVSFGIGLEKIQSSAAVSYLRHGITSSSSSVVDVPYPIMGRVYFFSYDESTADSSEISAAYGYEDTTTYGSSTFSSCGGGYLATGVTMHTSSGFVCGLRLHCAELTCSCDAPGDTASYCDVNTTASPMFSYTSPNPIDHTLSLSPNIRGKAPALSPVDNRMARSVLAAGADEGNGTWMTVAPAESSPASNTGFMDKSLKIPVVVAIGASAVVALGVIVGLAVFAIGTRRRRTSLQPSPSAPLPFSGTTTQSPHPVNGGQYTPDDDAHEQSMGPVPALTPPTVARLHVPSPAYTYSVDDD